MATENSDNYQGYIYLPQEKVYIPALPSGGCSFLDKPNYVDQEPVQIFEENKAEDRTDSKFRDIQQGSSYSQQFSKANKQELYDVLWDNYQSLNNTHKLKKQVIKQNEEKGEEKEQVGQQSQQPLKQEKVQTQSEAAAVQLLNGNRSPKSTNKVQQQKQQQPITQSQNQQTEQSQKDLNEQDRLKLTAELNQLLKQQEKLVKEIEYLEKADNNQSGKFHPLAYPVDGIRLQDREQRLKQFTSTSRDLPNSSFNTYYGKPAFGNYGAGNVHDKNSPFIAGQYLQTHNVNPHRGGTAPEFQQTYTHAMDLATDFTEPAPPRHRLDEIPTKKQLDYFRKTNPFYPHPNELLAEAFRLPQKGMPVNNQIKQSHPLLAQAQPSKQSSNYLSTSTQQQNQTSKKTDEKHNGNNKSISNSSVQEKSQKSSQQQSQQQSQQNNKQEGALNEQNKNKSTKIVEQLLSPKSSAGSNNKPPSPSQQVQIAHQAQNQLISQNKLSHTATSSFSQANQNQEKMDLLIKKKEKSSLIVDKITELPQYNPLCYSLRDDFPIDPMNPPEWYFRSLHECELNPQYYRSMNKQKLHNIPFAGKKASRQHDFFDILQHHPIGTDPCY